MRPEIALFCTIGLALAPACASDPNGAGDDGQDDGSGDGSGSDDEVTGTTALASADSGVFDVVAQGAVCDGTHDDTAAIRKAINAANAAGGGVVHLPSGRCRLKGAITLSGMVTLAGEGFHAPAAGAPGTLQGSWLIIDAGLLTTHAITMSGNGATVRDLGIWHEQPPVASGWKPRAFGYAINMAVPDTLVRHVWLANPTLGIHGIGRVTIENVAGQPIEVGIKIDSAYDVVRLRKIKFNWTADGTKYWSTSPAVKKFMLVGIESDRNDNPEINDIRVAGYHTGIHYGASTTGITSKFSMMSTFVNDATDCVSIDGPNTTGKFDRLTLRNCADVGIRIDGENNVISGADVDIGNVGNNGIRVDGVNAQLLVNQVSVVNYDHSGAGFPAIEAAVGSATVKVGLFRNFSGGRVGVGGVGHALVDSNAADAAFDLRIATPTEVTEEAVFPFAAKVSVKTYGAKGDGVTDDTAAIQAALDAAAAGGFANVLVPAGNYHMKGGVKVPVGVTLMGIGWATGALLDANGIPVAANAPKHGAYFAVDAANTKDIVTLGDHSAIQGIAFKWNQGAVVAGWAPRNFGFAVRVTGTDVKVRDVFVLNPTRGVIVSSVGTGSVLIDRVFGSPATIGIHLDTNAAVRANDIHFWPFYGLSGAFGKTYRSYVEAHATGFRSAHSAHAEVSNFFTITYQVGLELAANGAGKASTDFRLWNADQDIGVRGYIVTGAGTTANFANWSAQGDNAGPFGVTGLWIEPSATNAHVHGYNGDLRIFTGNAVRSDAAGADLRVSLMRFEAWGSSGPFPVVEGGAAGPELWANGL